VRPGLLLGLAAGFAVVAPLASGRSQNSTPAASLRSEGEQLAARSHSVVLELYALDSALDRARARLAALREDARDLRRRHEELTLALKTAHDDRRTAREGLAARVRQLYRLGEVSPIEVILGARSLSDVVSSLEQIERVASMNDEVLEELQSAQRRLAGLRRAVARCEARLAGLIRDAEATESRLAATRDARARYLVELTEQRRLNTQQLARLQAQAGAAQVRSEQLAAPVAAGSTSGSTTVALSGQRLTVSVTAYSLPGHTASGLPVGWGIVAVDPRLIPLGTRMYVPGYGEAIAADVGTAILGPKLDIWFPTLAQAQAWGRRTVTITVR
jgi:3D (Asp-Asp-Asp) domain-containing protein